MRPHVPSLRPLLCAPFLLGGFLGGCGSAAVVVPSAGASPDDAGTAADVQGTPELDASVSVDASSGTDAAAPPTGTIPVTRAACTPFGSAPRPLNTAENALFQPPCRGGGVSLSDFVDAEGTTRLACLYTPAAATQSHPLPLVVFIHPSVVGPDITSALSGIRGDLDTADLTGDPASPGFLLLEPAGRVVDDRYYPFPDNADSPGWDNWDRQMWPGGTRTVNGTAYPENVDATSFDHYIAEVVASNLVDPSRIYLMGWSNGSSMGVLYALNRPNIAAAAVYSAPDPFHAFNDPCPQTAITGTPSDDTSIQVFNPGVPIYHVHNDCDIAGLCPNSEYLSQSLLSANVDPISDQIITATQQSTGTCLATCGTNPYADYGSLTDPFGYLGNLPGFVAGTVNHMRWPSDWTSTMYAFLRNHPKP